ncbi:MAG: hypothetical protein IT211_10215 [Armatimonadetes bacterium]|nr:hypothetical protein [Armatimonadota bacterium]
MNYQKMLPIPLLLCAMVAIAAPTAARAAGEYHITRDTALASLKSSIRQAISMIEAKEYVPFLQRFVRPADMEALLNDCETLEQCAEQFAMEKAEILLQVLKKTKNRKPRMNRKASTATFTIPSPGEGKTSITWEQVQGVWYIRN